MPGVVAGDEVAQPSAAEAIESADHAHHSHRL